MNFPLRLRQANVLVLLEGQEAGRVRSRFLCSGVFFTDGDVYYDGLPISSVNLDSLRSNITIIPQMVRLSA